MGMDQYDAVDKVYDMVCKQLEDICQSGFDTVQEDTLKQLHNLVQLVQQYGMDYLSELLEKLYQSIAPRRHQFEQKEEGTVLMFALLNQYLYVCRQQIEYDRAAAYYSQDQRIEEIAKQLS